MKKLNLGCGQDYREGWTNLDFNKNVKTDVYHDINKKLPFKDNSFDLVFARDSLEDVYDVNKAIEEIWRVLKPNGIFILIHSFGGSFFDFRYIHHKSHLVPKSLDMYTTGTETNLRYGFTTKARFKKKKVRIRMVLFHFWLPEWLQYLSILINPFVSFKGEYLAVK